LYSLVLAIVVAVSAALAGATDSLGFLFAFGLQTIFFWAIFLYRKQLTGRLVSATTGGGPQAPRTTVVQRGAEIAAKPFSALAGFTVGRASERDGKQESALAPADGANGDGAAPEPAPVATPAAGSNGHAPATAGSNGHAPTLPALSAPNGHAPAPAATNGHAPVTPEPNGSNGHASVTPEPNGSHGRGAPAPSRPQESPLAAPDHAGTAPAMPGRFQRQEHADPGAQPQRRESPTAAGSSLRAAHEEAARQAQELRELRAAPRPREEPGP
jgi:hypothetical protein